MPTARRPPVRTKPAQRKLTSALKVRAEVRKQNSVLLGDIQAHVVKEVARDKVNRRSDIIHPSEMAKADWCPRATCYRILGEHPNNEQAIGYGTASIFETGNTAHTKWQNWVREMGRLYGRWLCTICDHRWLATSPLACENCGSVREHLRYREVPLDGESRYLVAGHADGAVLDIHSLIEVKTIGTGTIRIEEPELVRKHTKKTTDGKTVLDLDSLWNGIKRPFPSHRRQGQIYLHLANVMGLDVDRIVFLYENKANQQPKEFSVTYDPDYTYELFETARDIKFAVADGTVLDRPKGFEHNKAPCNKCPFLGVCWKEDDDGTEDHPQRDAGDGPAESGSETAAGAASDLTADKTTQRRARTAGRPHRGDRRRADAAVHPDDEVERVPERTGRGSGDRRTVRRRRRRQDQGTEEP
jgi:CRISPR/Cas system-associated exonuclease Cas4 (RecB family)